MIHLDSALKRLKVLQQENLAKEAKLKEEIEKAQEQGRAQIEDSKRRAEEILEVAKKEAQRLSGSLEGEARREAERIVRGGREETDRLRRRLLAEIETKALNLSIQMIEYTFSSGGKEVLQRQFTEEIIGEIEGIEESKFSVKTENIKIRTACPLSEGQKEVIKKTLSGKLGMAVKLAEKIDEELIAGIIIQIDSLVIDGSLRNRLKKIILHLKKA